MKRNALSKFPKLTVHQNKVLEAVIEGAEIQVTRFEDGRTEYSLVNPGGDTEELREDTFIKLKDHGLIKLKYSPSLDVELWS